MRVKSALKISALTFVLALAGRLALNYFYEIREDQIAKQACSLVSRQLETGSLRETYEQLQYGLAANGYKQACVTVTDNGRSYTQECAQNNQSSRSLLCKAEANSGVRATMAFPPHPIFNRGLLNLLLLSAMVVLIFSVLLKGFVRTLVKSLGDEIQKLMENQTSSRPQLGLRVIRSVLNFFGIQKIILSKVQEFDSQIKDYQRKTQQELTQRAHLEQEANLNALYVEKVKQIRHDIRSPLSSVQSVFEKMNSTTLESKSLASAIRRIQILLDDLNQVDRIAEIPKLVIAEVVAEEVVSMLSSKLQETKSAKISIEYDPSELCPVQVSPNDFQSGLENLVENALDAIAVGGHVKIRISRQQAHCLIEVEDNGSGISPEFLPNLFSSGATFGKANGIGLGLFHTKKNIESWGGHIACIPLGSGTKFEIRIPIMQVGVVFAGLPPTSSLIAKRCLVVDDDSLVARAFKSSGFQVQHWASDTTSGAHLLAQGNPDNLPIFVDYRLGPDDLGTDLIAQQPIRKNIFLCTNDFDDLELIRKAKALGVRILPKPLVFYGLRVPETSTMDNQKVEIAHM